MWSIVLCRQVTTAGVGVRVEVGVEEVTVYSFIDIHDGDMKAMKIDENSRQYLCLLIFIWMTVLTHFHQAELHSEDEAYRDLNADGVIIPQPLHRAIDIYFTMIH